MSEVDLPTRVIVGANGAYWRDYSGHYSMCPVSEDNDPIEPVGVYIPLSRVEYLLRGALTVKGWSVTRLDDAADLLGGDPIRSLVDALGPAVADQSTECGDPAADRPLHVHLRECVDTWAKTHGAEVCACLCHRATEWGPPVGSKSKRASVPWADLYARLAEKWGQVLEAADKAEDATVLEVVDALRDQGERRSIRPPKPPEPPKDREYA